MDARNVDSTFDETSVENSDETPSSKNIPWWRGYRWRMRHYFYIHVAIFLVQGLLGGLGVLLIENRIRPNRFMSVHYIDAWFVASSCVYSCGLTTLDFGRLSTYSQVLLMILTISSGITVSTLPALVIKARSHKHESGPRVDDDHSAFIIRCDLEKKLQCSPEAEIKISRLPTAEQLRYRAYLTCLGLIPVTCVTIYLGAFIAIGGWIHTHYRPFYLRQDGRPVNPWYASFVITATGFNQNGLTPWSDGMARFVEDVGLNLLVMALVMSGTSFFPFIFRNVIMFSRWLVPWHHKVIFDYILLNNHRLSTILFPTVQTRIYLTVTFALYALGISVSMILDYNSQSFASYSRGTRVLIFAFQTVNARFAGFQTIDITLFAEGTLIIYLLLMAVKPQMLCALDSSPFELEWQSIREGQKMNAKRERRFSTTSIDSYSANDVFPVRRLHRVLRDRSVDARQRAEDYFASVARKARNKASNSLKLRLFILLMLRRLLSHSFTLLTRTRTWLFIFIFLVCSFESYHMTPIDENVTVMKIIFEIVSAFGAVGMTTGYPNLKSSFATVLSRPSKIVLLLTMLMGRHRGLLESMKDQEKIEFSAHTLLEKWRQMARNEYPLNSQSTSLSSSSPLPPEVKPRTTPTNRPGRARYVLERPNPETPPRMNRPRF